MPELDGGFIDAINKVPNPLKNPEDESTLAWDIMWSDPVRYTHAPTIKQKNYSQTCEQRPPKGEAEYGLYRQVVFICRKPLC